MSFTNPHVIFWTPATANADGSPITENITYQVGTNPGTTFVAATAVVVDIPPDQVTPDPAVPGQLTAPIGVLNLDMSPGKSYAAAVREVNADTKVPGDYSAAFDFNFADTRIPNPPTGFGAD